MLRPLVWLLLSTGLALAQPTDFTATLKRADGTLAEDCSHVTDGKCDKTVPMTLGRLCAAALSLPKRGEIAEQVINGNLARQLINAKHTEISPEDLVKIKTAIGELGYSRDVVADAVAQLDLAVKGVKP